MIRKLIVGCLSLALVWGAVGCEDSKSAPKLEGSVNLKPKQQDATGAGGNTQAGAAASLRQ